MRGNGRSGSGTSPYLQPHAAQYQEPLTRRPSAPPHRVQGPGSAVDVDITESVALAYDVGFCGDT
ncbi:hypothetical protein GCM10027421_26820 [Microbacterium shaanxiense]